jgi:phenylalanyl-tRNA synthetase beta chain
LRPSASAAILWDDTVAGYIGLLHPALQRSLDIRQNVVLFEIDLEMLGDSDLPKLVEFSKLPGVTRDLAVVVDDATPVAELTKHVAAVLGDSLKACEVFDIYRGQGVDTGRKSVAMGLILQGTSRTLTDQETDDMILQVMRRLEHELGATIRS